jgi:hypothetical protein
LISHIVGLIPVLRLVVGLIKTALISTPSTLVLVLITSETSLIWRLLLLWCHSFKDSEHV